MVDSREKPLHVRVAEALGWTEVHLEEHGGANGTPAWYGTRAANDHVYASLDVRWFGVPRFDESWSATGPLIERFRIDLFSREGNGVWTARAWVPNDDPIETLKRAGNEPLTAVCNLILALHAAGKLDA